MRLLSLLAALFIAVTPSRAAKIVLVAGTPEAPLHEPFGAEADAAGNVFIIEMISGNRLLKVDTKGVLTHLAGTGIAGGAGDDGPGLSAEFQGAHCLALLPKGDVLIGDTWNGRVRRYHSDTKTVTTEEGFGVQEKDAKKAGPYCIALNPSVPTQLIITDLLRVHSLNLDGKGIAHVIAGNGQKGKPVDGTVSMEAPLSDPRAVAVDRQGNLYILERSGHALRVVDTSGRIHTVVNASGKQGATGDGGPALEATMNGPKYICIDNDSGVLIADAENHLIRKYWPENGTITRIAGTGKSGSAGVGGDPLQCQLNRPHGVSVDRKTGEILVTDSYNNRVLKIIR